MPASGFHAQTLLEAVHELSGARDVAAVSAVVRRAARQLSGADGVTIVLREDGDICHYADEDAIAPLWKGQRFPMSACISGWVMQQGEPAIIPDVYADDRIPHDAYRPTFVQSLAMMPVPGGIAAIGAYWSHRHRASAAEIDVLQRLAENTALALENIRLRAALEEAKRARLQLEGAAGPRDDARFEVMADTSPLMIWVTDAAGQIEFVNRSYCEFFGVTEDDVRGPNWQPLVHPDDADFYVSRFMAALKEGRPFAAEARVRRADGAWRYVASYGAPRLSTDGRVLGMVGSSPDITDLKAATAEAKDAARLRDEFIATVAHELRQPLHASAAALQMLQLGLDGGAGERARSVLKRQFQQMSRMVEDLLDASHIVRGDITLKAAPVDLRDVARDALETVWPMIHERGHQVEHVPLDAPVVVRGDASRLQQVLVNLLTNAAKFTPGRGRIRLAVEPDRRQATIRVEDNGIGIPPNELPRIFDVFARVDGGAEKGFGIGLAVARSLVERHGGRLVAHSDGPGRGSAFTIRLPLSHAG